MAATPSVGPSNVQLKRQLTANQLEFFSEDDEVTIIPKFRSDPLEFISGFYGPFIPSVPIEVPIWLAVSLRKRQKCTIQCPEWLDVERLRALKNAEQHSNILSYEKLPFHYMEIATQLLHCAGEDIRNVDEVREIIEDIWTIRSTKAKDGNLLQINDQTSAIKFNNLSAMEINTLRPYFVQTLDQFQRLQVPNVDST